MANSSIPNSTPATGRTSTTSSRRSRKQNNRAQVSEIQSSVLNACAQFIGICRILRVQKQRQAAALQSALRSRKIPRWRLDVERWTFFSSRRVKGAWWPSRSSKPSSPRKWRGRFDSYPLRQFPATAVAVSLCGPFASPLGDGYRNHKFRKEVNRNAA